MGVAALLACGCAGEAPVAKNTPAAGAAAAPVSGAPEGHPAVRSFADFRPSRDGFAFVNDFSGSSLPVDLGAAAESRLGLPRHYGLCGGMSFAAADYYLARAAVPADTHPPVRGSRLYLYLYKRQATSVGPSGAMALKFLEWMRLPDTGADSCRARTAAELPPIRAALQRGEPVMLGLVLTSAARRQEPWNNHQVLAYAIAAPSVPGAEELRIYDPNFPHRDDVVIRIVQEPDGPRCSRIVPGRRETAVRGVFRMAYEPVDPASAREAVTASPSGTSSPPPAGSPHR